VSSARTCEAVVTVAVPCPFCAANRRGVYSAGEDAEGAFVLHTVPVCAEYERLDPLEFLAAARSRIEGTS
jgi:hypothetical protein